MTSVFGATTCRRTVGSKASSTIAGTANWINIVPLLTLSVWFCPFHPTSVPNGTIGQNEAQSTILKQGQLKYAFLSCQHGILMTN
jgi:hypothetical protein